MNVGEMVHMHGAGKHTNITRTVFLVATSGFIVSGTANALLENPAVQALADAALQVQLGMRVPDDFVSFTKVEAVWRCAAASGNLYWRMQASYAASGEANNTHTETNTFGTTATGGANLINVQAAPTALTLSSLALGDYLGLRFERDGTNAADTLNDVVYFLGLLFTYTASQ